MCGPRRFYDYAVSSAVFHATVCWGSSITAKGTNRLSQIIRTADSVLGNPVDMVAETILQY